MAIKKVFISHESALEFWRRHDLSNAGGIRRTRRASLRNSVSGITAIKPLIRNASPLSGRIYGARINDDLGVCLCDLQIFQLPLHVMVDSRSKRQKRDGIVTHLYEQSLPEGSFCKVSSNVYVSSPELTLCQMACELSFVDTLELCLEFCGGYTLSTDSERGFDDRPALTSASQLTSFVKQFAGHRGAKQIRPLLHYVVDESASPMESIALMLLCLPSRLGGYQLPLPEHNIAIPINERARSHTKRKRLICDLFWRKYKLDVECDSTRYHSSMQQLGIDSDRRIILDAMGYKYVGITYWQLENEAEFENVVQAIRRAMGFKLRNAPDRIRHKRNVLRTYLVTPRDMRQPL